MAAPPEKLARSLEALKVLQDRGVVAIRSSDLERIDRERLVRNGFLQPVMKLILGFLRIISERAF